MTEQKNISDILYENISRTSVSTFGGGGGYHALSFGVIIISCFQLASVWFVVVNLIASGLLLGQILNPKIVFFFSGGIIKDILLRKNIYRFQLSICKWINKGKKQVSLNLAVHTANPISGFIKKNNQAKLYRGPDKENMLDIYGNVTQKDQTEAPHKFIYVEMKRFLISLLWVDNVFENCSCSCALFILGFCRDLKKE